MTSQQNFGGFWTDRKLECLKGYLEAYVKIFARNLRAQFLHTIYVDAFAGTGNRKPRSGQDPTEMLKGSVRVALEVEPGFNQYIFIEKSRAKCKELENLKVDYPSRASSIEVLHAEAGEFLLNWCKSTDWRRTRAVVFLDPFGMQIEWSVLQALAETKAIDLWLLVPLGIGANRLLTKKEMPPEDWAQRLTKFFGTDDWQHEFYQSKQQLGLFDVGGEQEKNATHDHLKEYFMRRLSEIFAGIAPNPVVQKNSRVCQVNCAFASKINR